MKHSSYIILSVLTLAMLLVSSCSDISESERLEYVKPEVQGRNILIEDFTGQNCVNCPKATAVIEQLQQQYGADTIIAVAIHSGYFGVHNSPTQVGLATDLGDTYYNHWGIESQPNGIIDRSDGIMPYDWWTNKVTYDLEQKAQVNIDLTNSYDAATNSVSMRVQLVGSDSTTVSGRLQLWAVEDSIHAYQLMPDGSRNDAYIHNHVLRAAVNGTWGEKVTVAPGQSETKTYQLPLDSSWNPAHVAIVAFVYDDNGVKQVVIRSIGARQTANNE